jgi:dTDP-4-dehydrorhamnose reductase
MLSKAFDYLERQKPILVFGSYGQLGKAIRDVFNSLNLPIIFLGRDNCDLAHESMIVNALNKYQPQLIVNAAGYTNVDKSESTSELAFLINAKAPELMAEYISSVPNGMFVHYSTDYVFGDTKSTPYSEDEDAGPIERLCVYGKSKLMGERAIQRVFNPAGQLRLNCVSPLKYYIFRTSWLYGAGVNFINNVLNLAAKNEKLRVVNDQIGVPTSARWLADISIQIAGARAPSGIYHAVPDGEISWYELATFSVSKALNHGLNIKLQPHRITPVKASDFFRVNIRPCNSRLDNSKLKKSISEINAMYKYPHWEPHVEDYIKEICFNIK